MRLAELSGTASELAPGADELAVPVENDDPVIPVAVADIEVAIGSDRDIVRLIHVRLVFARLIGRADCQNDFAVGGEVAHGLSLRIYNPEIAGVIEPDRVGIFEKSVLPPILHE